MLGAVVAGADTTQRLGEYDRVSVPALKSSIYVGSVTLVPSVFTRDADGYAATYEVKVWPWFWWGESGRVHIKISDAELARALRGETVEFSGSGENQKHKPRSVSGRVQPGNNAGGKIKIRISADGLTLVFNGTYRFDNAVK